MRHLLIACLALILCGLATEAQGGPTAQVAIRTAGSTFAYDPSSVTISVSDSVRWSNKTAALHTATGGDQNDGSDGSFDTGSVSPGQSRAVKFNTAGDYPYFCAFHSIPSFYGTFVGVVHVMAPTPVSPETWGQIRRRYEQTKS